MALVAFALATLLGACAPSTDDPSGPSIVDDPDGSASADVEPDRSTRAAAYASTGGDDQVDDGDGVDADPDDDDAADGTVRSTATATSTSVGCGADQVDVNAAEPHQLERIVHIGTARAERLVRLRPFANLRDLTRIPGIGEKRLADIAEQALACAG